jgi:hypothetical protein
VPDAPLVIETHDAPGAADHEHPSGAVTRTVPVLAPPGSESEAGFTDIEQSGGAPPPKPNWFEGSLVPRPPGPTAATRAT